MGVGAGLFLLGLVGCCVYHECYLKKKQIEEGNQIEKAKSERRSARGDTAQNTDRMKHTVPSAAGTKRTFRSES